MSGDHRGGIAVNAVDVKKAVKAREREIVRFLSKVLQTPSVTGYEAAVAEVIAREIEVIGLRARIEEAEKEGPIFWRNGRACRGRGLSLTATWMYSPRRQVQKRNTADPGRDGWKAAGSSGAVPTT